MLHAVLLGCYVHLSLGNKGLLIPSPTPLAGDLFCQRNAVVKGHAVPPIFHELPDVRVISAVGGRDNVTVVLILQMSERRPYLKN